MHMRGGMCAGIWQGFASNEQVWSCLDVFLNISSLSLESAIRFLHERQLADSMHETVYPESSNICIKHKP